MQMFMSLVTGRGATKWEADGSGGGKGFSYAEGLRERGGGWGVGGGGWGAHNNLWDILTWELEVIAILNGGGGAKSFHPLKGEGKGFTLS